MHYLFLFSYTVKHIILKISVNILYTKNNLLPLTCNKIGLVSRDQGLESNQKC